MAGLDGPGLARLAGLSTRDMAAVMGLRMDREKFKQQKQRDVVNEMYQTAIMNKIKEETRLMEPKAQTALARAEAAAKSGMQKEYEFYAAQVRAQGGEPMGLEDFMASKNTWIQQYKYYAMQQIRMGQPVKDFDQWSKETRRASALTIQQQGEKAGVTAGARAEATQEVKYLGPDLRKDAIANLKAGDQLFLADTDVEKENLIAGEMEKILKATFPSVERWTNAEGVKGWRITKNDGSIVFKGR